MKKILTLLGAGALLLSACLLTSCEGDKYYETGADMENLYFEVKPNQWGWNSDNGRFEAAFRNESSIVDSYMYDGQGAIYAGIYLTQQVNGRDQEVLCTLPYVYTYEPDNMAIIGYDISLANGGQIVFYIQDDSLTLGDITATYDFKVTLFWQQ